MTQPNTYTDCVNIGWLNRGYERDRDKCPVGVNIVCTENHLLWDSKCDSFLAVFIMYRYTKKTLCLQMLLELLENELKDKMYQVAVICGRC